MTQTIDITVLVKPHNPKTGKSDCPQCDATLRKLNKLGAEYTVQTLYTDEAAAEQDAAVEEGIQAAPIVVVKGEKSTIRWGGYQPPKFDQHITPFLHKEA